MVPAIVGAMAAQGVQGFANTYWNQTNMENQADIQKDLMRFQWENFSSPQAQLRSFASAGVNPAHALSGGAVNTAQPSASVSHAPVMTNGVDQLSSFARSFSEDALNIAKKENEEADTENKHLQNKTQLQRDIAYLDNLLKNTELSEATKKKTIQERDTLLENLYTLDARNRAEMERNESEARLNDAKANLTDAQITYQQIINELEPLQRRALIRQIYANEAELLAAAREHDASALDHAADVALKGVDKLTREKLMPVLIDKAQAEADLEWFKTGNEAKRYVGGEIGYRTPLVGHGGSYNSYNPRYRYHKRK